MSSVPVFVRNEPWIGDSSQVMDAETENRRLLVSVLNFVTSV